MASALGVARPGIGNIGRIGLSSSKLPVAAETAAPASGPVAAGVTAADEAPDGVHSSIYIEKRNATLHHVVDLIATAHETRPARTPAAHSALYHAEDAIKVELSAIYGMFRKGVHIFDAKVHEFTVSHLLGVHAAEDVLHKCEHLFHEFAHKLGSVFYDEKMAATMAKLDAQDDSDSDG